MRKFTTHIIDIADRVLFIGFTLQIILGIVWMVGNFAHFQHFGEMNSLAYPVIIAAAKGIGKIFPIPYYCLIYIFQIFICAVAVYELLATVTGNFEDEKYYYSGRKMPAIIWSVLGIITIFPIMQCMMAVLPIACAAAGMLFELKYVYLFMTKDTNGTRTAVKLCISWLWSAVMLREYTWFGMVPLVAVLFINLFKKKCQIKQVIGKIIMIVITLALAESLHIVCASAGMYTDDNIGLLKKMLSRTSYTTVLKDWDTWTDNIKEKIPGDIVKNAGHYADNIELEFIPYVDEALGEEANAFYRQTIAEAWTGYKRQIIHEVAWDTAGYALSPFLVNRQLNGRGYASLSARNYELMSRSKPIVTKYYVNYSLGWFMSAFIIAFFKIVLMLVCRALNGKDIIKNNLLLSIGGFTWVTMIAVMCLWYVMQGAGIMDYKKMIIATAFWGILMLPNVKRVFKTEKNNETGQRTKTE